MKATLDYIEPRLIDSTKRSAEMAEFNIGTTKFIFIVQRLAVLLPFYLVMLRVGVGFFSDSK